jgi:hypothetical protein
LKETSILDVLDGRLSRFTDAIIRVVVPLAAATAVAFLVSLYLATAYLPSHTTTTLLLRSGVIPTLKDRNFYRFRKAPDQVTIITGSMFWGALISSIIAGGLVGLVIFAFVWQATVYAVQRLVAIILGEFFLLLYLPVRP